MAQLNTEKIIEPLFSRLVILHVPEYSFEEFTDIAVSRLAKEKVDRDVATITAEKVCTVLDSRDIREVIKVGRLARNIQEVSSIVRI